jgi:hypothetical protein
MIQCPFCRESLPELPPQASTIQHHFADPDKIIRRGLLFMLLAALIGYFAGGYSAWPLPVHVIPAVSALLSPLLFLCGLGLSAYGFYLQHRSAIHHTS